MILSRQTRYQIGTLLATILLFSILVYASILDSRFNNIIVRVQIDADEPGILIQDSTISLSESRLTLISQGFSLFSGHLLLEIFLESVVLLSNTHRGQVQSNSSSHLFQGPILFALTQCLRKVTLHSSVSASKDLGLSTALLR